MRSPIRRLLASRRHARAFTLVEILVAMVVTLIMLGIVVTIFGLIGQNVSDSRSVMEMTDQLRATRQRLQLDLAGITVTMIPPRAPEKGEGYFEYIEGPAGRIQPFADTTVGDTDDIIMFTTQSANEPFVGRHFGGVTLQSQVAEVAWFLRGTTLYRRQLLVKPELNRQGNMPTAVQQYATGQSFYAVSDVSVHADGKGSSAVSANLGPLPAASDPLRIVANSLGDLTKRENRYAHVPLLGTPADAPFYGWPFDARKYGYFPIGGSATQATTGRLGLATLQECSDTLCPLPIGTSAVPRFFPFIQLTNRSGNPTEDFDAWDNPNPWNQVDQQTGQINPLGGSGNPTRLGEDVILTNVLSFDVRVWDPTAPIYIDSSGNLLTPGDPGPGYGVPPVAPSENYATALANGYTIVARGAYVDLNYAGNVPPALTASYFSGPGDLHAGLSGISFAGGVTVPPVYVPAIYDTWSTHYERDGINEGDYYLLPANPNPPALIDEGTNGLDDNGDGIVDDYTEQEAPPPYPHPLRGLQIKIRCFDPDSQQIREVTVVQEFLPE